MNIRYKFFLIVFSFFPILYSCNKNVTKVIVEHDPIVKIIEEHDSIAVFPRDSAKIKQPDVR
jgi:hypothetical protein